MEAGNIQENRLWNLRQLIRIHGGTTEVARIAKKTKSFVSAIAGPHPTKNIGDKVAREIERAFGLLIGQLDLPRPEETRSSDTALAELATYFATATEDDKYLILKIARLIVSRNIVPNALDEWSNALRAGPNPNDIVTTEASTRDKDV